MRLYQPESKVVAKGVRMFSLFNQNLVLFQAELFCFKLQLAPCFCCKRPDCAEIMDNAVVK